MAVGLIIGLIVGVVALIVWLWNGSEVRVAVDKLPGPRALPFIGNAHMFKPDGRGFFEQILKFCRDYGEKGVFRLWLGTQPAIVVTKAHTFEVLLNSTKHITKAREYDLLFPWVGTGLLTSTGDKWKRRRRQLTPTFHFKILDDFLQIFSEQSDVMVKRLKERSGETKSFDIFPYITLCALDIICESAMGKHFGAQSKTDSDYVKAVYEIGEIIQMRMKKPWLRPDFLFMLTKAGKVHQTCLKILHDFSRKVITQRSKEFEQQMGSSDSRISMEDLQAGTPFLIGKQKRLAFLDMLLVLSKGGAGLTHSDIQEEVDTFMFEGHDTTAAGINWATYLLGSHPEIQKKVQEEQDEIFGDDRERPAVSEDIKRMKYLERVIKESLRIFPSVPMIARSIQQECVIGGYQIPKGCSAIMVISALHMDPEYFPDPHIFDPDRWLLTNSTGRHAFSYVPFSAGMRNCIGQKFAMNEEKVLLSSLMRNFTIKSHQARDEVHPVGELIQRPEHGIQVTIETRPA